MIVSFVIVTRFEIKHVRKFKTIHWIISSGGRRRKGGKYRVIEKDGRDLKPL